MEVSKDQGEDIKISETPSSSKDLSKSLSEEAFNNFLQGKRHMLVQDYTFAVQSLATACELYVKHFGELAIECGEVYFLYGKALFRLSQQQSGVLGGAINEAGSNEDEEEEKSSGEESKENEDSEKNNSENEAGDEKDADENSKDGKEPSESTDSPPAAVEDENKEVKVQSTEEKVEEPEAAAEDPVVQDETSEENQPESEMEDDLELAWNTLETAKSIFKRQNDVESQLKVAEILQLLAEISMESDNNAAAINDLKECLAIQEKHLEPDNRILAETYYQMGLAQMLDKQYFEALSNFKTTMKILNLRKENLQKKHVPDTVGGFESADNEMEIADLEQILLDIKEKIEDTEELIRNTKKELEEALMKDVQSVQSSVNSGASCSSSSNSSSKPVTNITHLLKRKKQEESDNDPESKRIKITASVPNGDSNVVPETISGSEQMG